MVEIDLLLTVLGAVGIVQSAPAPQLTAIFNISNLTSVIGVVILFVLIPVICVIIAAIWEAIISYFEAEKNNHVVRLCLFVIFVETFFALIFVMIAIITWQSEEGGIVALIVIAFSVWGARFVINQLTIQPIVLSAMFLLRRRFGKERGDDPEVKRCPGLCCCHE